MNARNSAHFIQGGNLGNAYQQITSSNVEVFQNSQFGEIRAIKDRNGNPFFCLSDVASSLGLSNVSKLKTRLLEKGVTTSKVLTSGGAQEMIFIDEPNLYKCIFQSRKKEAEEFQNWVTSEVLPAIRKTGGYIGSNENDSPEVIMAKALMVAQKTIAENNKRVQMLEESNNLQQKQIQKLEPKARYTDEVLQSTSTFTTTQMADDLGMSAKTLNKKLESLGVIYKQSGQWHLKALYKDKGYTDIRVSKYTVGEEIKTAQSLVWTELGRVFLNGLRNNGQI